MVLRNDVAHGVEDETRHSNWDTHNEEEPARRRQGHSTTHSRARAAAAAHAPARHRRCSHTQRSRQQCGDTGLGAAGCHGCQRAWRSRTAGPTSDCPMPAALTRTARHGVNPPVGTVQQRRRRVTRYGWRCSVQ